MRVLLVEDDPAIAGLLNRYLLRNQHQVTWFESSTLALESFSKEPASFDVAITDLSLAGMSGEDLVLNLLAKRPELPVVIATGYPYTADHLSQAVRRQIRILQKPFLPKQLMELLAGMHR